MVLWASIRERDVSCQLKREYLYIICRRLILKGLLCDPHDSKRLMNLRIHS